MGGETEDPIFFFFFVVVVVVVVVWSTLIVSGLVVVAGIRKSYLGLADISSFVVLV